MITPRCSPYQRLSALEMDRRWEEIESAAGSRATTGHDWDGDPAG
jgi:hypothetical protein